ncbi:hypothetical protein GZ77_20150 [Endozoicomonas montiporae]|uniref:Uncharacterized protein n=2 Tax=Endozoicomonas montiporae TaxID=1027273 RepID=A0A081N2V5_9GAMM|nr:hypothetical protein EZMO1_4119 [Endozoicomonas montiporae CL-33]KEQ12778.1 hypothetical protein GZ77_20150 [Endozoicomonas montiporae]
MPGGKGFARQAPKDKLHRLTYAHCRFELRSVSPDYNHRISGVKSKNGKSQAGEEVASSQNVTGYKLNW